MSKTLIELQLTVSTYVIVGIILKKTRIINDDAQKFLSELIISVLLPISVFVSFLKTDLMSLLDDMILIFLISLILEVSIYFISKKKPKIFNEKETSIYRYSVLVSNGGLIGTPIMEGLFGSEGVILCNIFMIPTRILCYSLGEILFKKDTGGNKQRFIKSIVTNKVIIAMLIALFVRLSGILLPEPIYNGLNNIGKCLSPISLICIGSMINFKCFTDKQNNFKILLICLLRLIIIPVLTYTVCMMCKLDFIKTTTLVLLMGMPVGTTAASFAKKYDSNVEFASAVVISTTLLSSVTLVLLMRFIEFMF